MACVKLIYSQVWVLQWQEDGLLQLQLDVPAQEGRHMRCKDIPSVAVLSKHICLTQHATASAQQTWQESAC